MKMIKKWIKTIQNFFKQCIKKIQSFFEKANLKPRTATPVVKKTIVQPKRKKK